jgi:hypothetical protein
MEFLRTSSSVSRIDTRRDIFDAIAITPGRLAAAGAEQGQGEPPEDGAPPPAETD